MLAVGPLLDEGQQRLQVILPLTLFAEYPCEVVLRFRLNALFGRGCEDVFEATLCTLVVSAAQRVLAFGHIEPRQPQPGLLVGFPEGLRRLPGLLHPVQAEQAEYFTPCDGAGSSVTRDASVAGQRSPKVAPAEQQIRSPGLCIGG